MTLELSERQASTYVRDHRDALAAEIEARVTAHFQGGAPCGVTVSEQSVRDVGYHLSRSEPGAQLGTAGGTEAKPAPAQAEAQVVQSNLVRILIAEDNVLNQKVLVHLLKSMGYGADVAENGALAVAAAASHPYDLVLMDVRMPEMDGLEATRRICALPCERRPRIYALTAGVAPDEQQKCLDAGMEGFLAKPVQREELIAVLKHIARG